MIYILGSDGFVGSAFMRYCQQHHWPHQGITKANYSEFKGTTCDLFINANGNSKKFLANQNPVNEFELSTLSVYRSLFDFKFKKYVYLSSSDVYPDCSNPNTTQESIFIDESKQSPYGFHKYLSEKIVKKQCPQWLIFRLSGMVGENLRKNPIFDILQGGPLWVKEDSEFQFMNTDDVARIVFSISANVQNDIFNLGGSGTIKIGEIIRFLEKTVTYNSEAKTIIHNFSVDKIYSRFPRIETTSVIRSFLKCYLSNQLSKESLLSLMD